MTVEVESLKTACYFSRMEPVALEDVSRFLFERKLPTGNVILWEEEENGVLYFVISGLVKLITTSAEGREFIIRMVYGGDSINDELVFGKGEVITSAISMSPVVLYGLRKPDLDKIIQAYPQVSLGITDVFASRQSYLVRLATELVFKNITSRLARFLLEKEKLVRAGIEEPKITQQDMASMIGTVREMVSRSLRELESIGAIQIKHNEIIIANRELLLELSTL